LAGGNRLCRERPTNPLEPREGSALSRYGAAGQKAGAGRRKKGQARLQNDGRRAVHPIRSQQQRPYIRVMSPELSDEERSALAALLRRAIDGDRHDEDGLAAQDRGLRGSVGEIVNK
jgi:hypothetical protein